MNPLKMREKRIGKWSPSSRKASYKANMSDFYRGYDGLSTYSHYPQRKKKNQKERKGCYGFLITIFQRRKYDCH